MGESGGQKSPWFPQGRGEAVPGGQKLPAGQETVPGENLAREGVGTRRRRRRKGRRRR